MATAKELLAAGNLHGAIEAVTGEVRGNPTDAARRTFLFELLCFAGEWERADKQLEVIGSQSAQAEIGVQAYRNLLKAERARQRVFAEGVPPNFFLTPPPYISALADGLRLIREGDLGAARARLEEAEEQRPACAGKLNGQPFEDFRDSDDLVAPVLEVIVQEEYTWLPFEQISTIEINPPQRLRDLIWLSGRVGTINEVGGFAGEVFIPVLYAGSSRHPNDQVKLGRLTEWENLGGELLISAGMRLFQAGDEEYALPDIRAIEFERAGQ